MSDLLQHCVPIPIGDLVCGVARMARVKLNLTTKFKKYVFARMFIRPKRLFNDFSCLLKDFISRQTRTFTIHYIVFERNVDSSETITILRLFID